MVKTKNVGSFTRWRKFHIKHMLLFRRPGKRKNIVDVAILLDNNQYVEYTLAFKQKDLTFWVASRIKSIFVKYFIDSSTDVMVNDVLDEFHPLYIYLNLLRPHIQFKMRTVTLDQIIGRIHYYFTKKSAIKNKFNSVWKSIIAKQVCPWITTQVDYALQNKSPGLQRIMKILRMGLFYMVVKNYMYAQTLRCISSKNV